MKVVCLMAYYNRPRLSRYAVESVLEQTHEDWELVIVDDQSDRDFLFDGDLLERDDRIHLHQFVRSPFDALPPVSDSFTVRDLEAAADEFDPDAPRVWPADLPRGPGRLSRALNQGLTVANLRLYPKEIVDNDVAVVYLADDDWFYPTWFASLVELLETEPEVDVVYGRLFYSAMADGKTDVYAGCRSRFPKEFATPAQELDQNQVAHRGSVLRDWKLPIWTEDDAEISAKVRGATGKASRGSDAAFFVDLWERSGEWKEIDTPAAFKRIHDYHIIGTGSVSEKRES